MTGDRPARERVPEEIPEEIHEEIPPEERGPVLVAYDGGAPGLDALTLGVRLAARLGVRAVVTTVHADPAPVGVGRVDAEWVAERREAAAAVLDGARPRVDALLAGTPGTEVAYRLAASGSAARGIVEAAAEVEASMIVVGSRAGGEADGGRVHAGSTANRLLSGSSRPVVLTPRNWAARASDPPGRVGAAYLPTREARAALVVAVRTALRLGARLDLFTAVAPEAGAVPWLVGGDGEPARTVTVRETFRAALDEAAAQAAGVLGADAVGTHLLTGPTVPELAALDDLDLLYCGSRGYGPVRSILLGGVSSRLVRRARSPVALVPRPS